MFEIIVINIYKSKFLRGEGGMNLPALQLPEPRGFKHKMPQHDARITNMTQTCNAIGIAATFKNLDAF